MSDPDPSFETRLESMERRLADIQRELAPEPSAGRPEHEPLPPPEHEQLPPPEPIPLRPRVPSALERLAGTGFFGTGPGAPAAANQPAAAAASAAPAPVPEPPAPESPAPPDPAPDPGDVELLGTLYADLLGSVRRLLDGYEAALGRLSRPATGRRPGPHAADARDAPGAADAADAAGEVEVTAGPFRDTAALREFERTLARLPGVGEVVVRGYRPGNRAILEVQLERETS